MQAERAQSRSGRYAPASLKSVGEPVASLDQDILTFCAASPALRELAFRLADHGHTHVGHVAQLTRYTVHDLAEGESTLVDALLHYLQRADLDFGLTLPVWQAPAGDYLDIDLD